MAKSGWYGGDVERVRQARADDVLAILDYENFLSDFEAVLRELNKDEK